MNRFILGDLSDSVMMELVMDLPLIHDQWKTEYEIARLHKEQRRAKSHLREVEIGMDNYNYKTLHKFLRLGPLVPFNKSFESIMSKPLFFYHQDAEENMSFFFIGKIEQLSKTHLNLTVADENDAIFTHIPDQSIYPERWRSPQILKWGRRDDQFYGPKVLFPNEDKENYYEHELTIRVRNHQVEFHDFRARLIQNADIESRLVYYSREHPLCRYRV